MPHKFLRKAYIFVSGCGKALRATFIPWGEGGFPTPRHGEKYLDSFIGAYISETY
jgi:hypothetical protein